eukprot:UC4_evm2s197
MGMVFGIISEETPQYEILAKRPTYEVRKYSSGIIASTDYRCDSSKSDMGSPFRRLAKYIGVFGSPENTTNQPISMTAPVLLSMDEGKERRTMSFILPSHFGTDVTSAPQPNDSSVRIEELSVRTQAVRTFSWGFTEMAVQEQLKILLHDLEQDQKYRIVLDKDGSPSYSAAGFNPPFTIPFLKKNEVMVDVDLCDD